MGVGLSRIKKVAPFGMCFFMFLFVFQNNLPTTTDPKASTFIYNMLVPNHGIMSVSGM